MVILFFGGENKRRMAIFEIFKSIPIGGTTKEKLISDLVSHGIQFNAYAHTLFEHPAFIVGEKAEKIDLVKVNLHDLQLTKPSFYSDIVHQASELGLKLCPLYLGAFLRLAYLDQPEGPYITIASENPEKDEECPDGFYVRYKDNVLWLRGYRATDDYEWPLESEFIFRVDGL